MRRRVRMLRLRERRRKSCWVKAGIRFLQFFASPSKITKCLFDDWDEVDFGVLEMINEEEEHYTYARSLSLRTIWLSEVYLRISSPPYTLSAENYAVINLRASSSQ